MTVLRDRLQAVQQSHRSTLAIGLSPLLERMPYPMQRHDDPFLPFGKAIIDATHDLTSAYVFDLAAYLSAGASGAIALERTIAYVPAPVLKILHGPFTRAEYARTASESAFNVDAVTLASVEIAAVTSYVQAKRRGVFIEQAGLIGVEEELRKLSNSYPGQIGTYHTEGDHSVLNLPPLRLRWYTDTVALASRADNFREAVRAAAEARRELA